MLQLTTGSYLHKYELYVESTKPYDTISYAVSADADTWMCPHGTSQYHTRPQFRRVITLSNVGEFPYPEKQTKGQHIHAKRCLSYAQIFHMYAFGEV